MSLTRKDFETIAMTLRGEKPNRELESSPFLYWQWRSDCQAIATACQQLSTRFNREKFFEACGVEQ